MNKLSPKTIQKSPKHNIQPPKQYHPQRCYNDDFLSKNHALLKKVKILLKIFNKTLAQIKFYLYLCVEF